MRVIYVVTPLLSPILVVSVPAILLLLPSSLLWSYRDVNTVSLVFVPSHIWDVSILTGYCYHVFYFGLD